MDYMGMIQGGVEARAPAKEQQKTVTMHPLHQFEAPAGHILQKFK